MGNDEPNETSLGEGTRGLRVRMREVLGDKLERFDEIATALGEMEFHAPEVGQLAPDFTLPDARGGELTLSARVDAGPVVLVFYRGDWCPYCNLQLRAFQNALEQLRTEGAQLVAISPQLPDGSISTAEQAELEFPVLSDVGNEIAERYGLVFRLDESALELHGATGIDLEVWNGDSSGQLPAAATFIVDERRKIAFASVSADYRWRVGPDEILAALRSD